MTELLECMMEPIEELEYKGYTVRIFTDEFPEDPREWDNLGKMIFFHKRYDLGDKHEYRAENYSSWEDLQQDVIQPGDVYLTVYGYDHGGLCIGVDRYRWPFNCPWDSGQLGWIVARADDIRKEFGVKRISRKLRKKVEEILMVEVETYNQYLTGEVYGYVIFGPDGKERDSCWGYYGLDYALEAAREAVDYIADRKTA